ncbi:Conserved hypothetical protein [Desulfamplus magnetovallimortis]|uniref:Uncharacterized protein n=1 Tax=Desulfamplus magnetovallimortis TaxID=1246637 RepID=L0R573_9BACT|nr:hypothetical protein [Desulfamplus magnetovallimortis]CCO06675.1 Conserved hypothetical protein [Desulfamplus magnetovallimortis BW-1]SLM32726.1 Conserved hypothetical protein [Desulfamplus magnetovallimortis]
MFILRIIGLILIVTIIIFAFFLVKGATEIEMEIMEEEIMKDHEKAGEN